MSNPAPPSRHGASDASVPNETQCGAVHVVRQVRVESPARPASVTEIVLGLRRAAGGGEDQ